MKNEIILDWLIEILDEGGYSFVEIENYSRINGINPDQLQFFLKKLFKENKIYIYLIKKNENLDLDLLEQEKSLDQFIEICRVEERRGSEHYLAISG